jgi:hypothetical protein
MTRIKIVQPVEADGEVAMTPEELALAQARQRAALVPKYGEPGWNPDARDPDTDTLPNQ